MHRILLFSMLFLCTSLSACSNGPRLGEGKTPLVVTKITDLPPPTSSDYVRTGQPYRIGAFDKLNVAVFGVAELTGDLQVDASGRLSFPLIGSVEAAGKTPQELADTIARALTVYVKNPQVTVNLREGTGNTFTVDGQVTEAGVYPIVGNMSLVRAIATAKGTSEFARLDDVVVFRTVGGQPMAALYNLGSIRRGTYADPPIYSNDIIVVGDSSARRLFKNILQVAPALVTPLVVLLNR